MKLSKQQRQMLIREIITGNQVSSQDELNQTLKRRSVDVTQATLSRDLREMRIARMPEDEGFRYVLPEVAEGKKLRRVVQEEIVHVVSNECVVVIKTLPGRAAGVGIYVDHLKHPDILGTVAGNDTVLVIPSNAKKTKEVVEYLRNIGSDKKNADAQTKLATAA